jgi:ABC-type dipeptide/oligopeptide/nickel transport system ATPase component
MTALSILRLLPDSGRVSAGRVDIDGVDITQIPEARMRDFRGRRVGIIFQEPSTSLNPVMTVGDQIAEVIERHTPLRGEASRARAIDWLARVGIPEPARRVDDYPFQMSGGQKQRVMIAIALAAEPEIVIADEPTTALDVTIQAQILDLLAELKDRLGLAVLLITHAMGVVAEVAQRVVVMYAGMVVEEPPWVNSLRIRVTFRAGADRSFAHRYRGTQGPARSYSGAVPKLIDPAEVAASRRAAVCVGMRRTAPPLRQTRGMGRVRAGGASVAPHSPDAARSAKPLLRSPAGQAVPIKAAARRTFGSACGRRRR